MSIRIATFNIEWFDDHFNADNSMKATQASNQKFAAVREILELIQADLVNIVEAPNTTTTTGIQSTKEKLENFASWAGLSTREAIIGYPSGGRQEIALLYDPDKMHVIHHPGGNSGSRSNPPFNKEFFYDANQDRIKEVYKHYRPPLEARVELIGGDILYIMGVHAKSKGIFNSVDQVHLARESQRNRLKLFAECAWIRRRVDDWLNDSRQFIVMGDINDGPGMDAYEMSHGRSAVELVLGNIFEPERILRTFVGEPKWTRYGWKPASASFKDRITEDYINVLIDHIFTSPNLPTAGDQPARVWNPFQDEDLKPLRDVFLAASDHFPITLDVDLQ